MAEIKSIQSDYVYVNEPDYDYVVYNKIGSEDNLAGLSGVRRLSVPEVLQILRNAMTIDQTLRKDPTT